MRSFIITGGAGFIGSNIAAEMVRRYPDDRIVVCDFLGDNDKWRNISGVKPDEIITPAELFYWLEANSATLDAIIHMGAISSTTLSDADVGLEVNVALPKILRGWALANEKRFIYASSAATYGAGEFGFDDREDLAYLQQLQPLNTYAWTKCTFDYMIARAQYLREPQPLQQVGLKFFNVYGPNEYHKGDQQSVVSKIYPAIRDGEAVKLFTSHHPDYDDGGQLRDFIYVKDCVDVVLWFIDNPGVSGLFNVGTGQARSFADLATAAFRALGQEPRIDYIDMPENLRERYQYYTQAAMEKLRKAGYDKPFMSLEEGVTDYVVNYLHTTNPYVR